MTELDTTPRLTTRRPPNSSTEAAPTRRRSCLPARRPTSEDVPELEPARARTARWRAVDDRRGRFRGDAGVARRRGGPGARGRRRGPPPKRSPTRATTDAEPTPTDARSRTRPEDGPETRNRPGTRTRTGRRRGSADRRPVHRRRAAGRGRPLRLHGPRANRSWACSTRSRAPGSGSSRRATRAAPAFMAEAHGQLTGRPAVALGTRAVGGTNLGIGIHTARQDSTPMFVAVGQVERALLGREAFQEIDQVATLGGLAKWAAEPHTADGGRRGDGRGDPPGSRRPTRDRSYSRCPRTCSTSRCPTTPGPIRPRPAGARADRRRDPRRSSSSWPPPGGRSSWPAAASCAHAPRRS